MKKMIKRADGSYSQRGLWDNIRANKGSGKKPTKEMLEQEAKIKSKMKLGGDWLQDSNELKFGGPTKYQLGQFKVLNSELEKKSSDTVNPNECKDGNCGAYDSSGYETVKSKNKGTPFSDKPRLKRGRVITPKEAEKMRNDRNKF